MASSRAQKRARGRALVVVVVAALAMGQTLTATLSRYPVHAIVVGATEVASLAALWHLQRRPSIHPVYRMGWSILVLLPLIGPILYLSVFRPPEPQAEVDRADERTIDL